MLSLKIVYINSSLSLVNPHTLKAKAPGLECRSSAVFLLETKTLLAYS